MPYAPEGAEVVKRITDGDGETEVLEKSDSAGRKD
jgi:hypothetical protein